jgi:hypothetical protein
LLQFFVAIAARDYNGKAGALIGVCHQSMSSDP